MLGTNSQSEENSNGEFGHAVCRGPLEYYHYSAPCIISNPPPSESHTHIYAHTHTHSLTGSRSHVFVSLPMGTIWQLERYTLTIHVDKKNK